MKSISPDTVVLGGFTTVVTFDPLNPSPTFTLLAVNSIPVCTVSGSLRLTFPNQEDKQT